MRYFLLGRNILSGFMISLKCSVPAVGHIFINRADSPAIFPNPDFMIRPIKPGQTGALRVTVRSFIVHQRVATAFEAWRLVRFRERVGPGWHGDVIIFMFLGSGHDADDDAEEDHET